MNAEEMLWSAFDSAMKPLAERKYRQLGGEQAEKAPPGETYGAAAAKGPVAFVVSLGTALRHPRGKGPPAAPVGAAALAEDYAEVFRSARRNTRWYFGLHLAVAISTITIFVTGALGAVLAALVWGSNLWAVVFGGASIASAFALFIAKPLQMVHVALVNSNRIDLLQLQYRQRLLDCAAQPTLDEQMTCREAAWKAIVQDLTALTS
jgi:hypothetical protein